VAEGIDSLKSFISLLSPGLVDGIELLKTCRVDSRDAGARGLTGLRLGEAFQKG
jgi:hypothetical protein